MIRIYSTIKCLPCIRLSHWLSHHPMDNVEVVNIDVLTPIEIELDDIKLRSVPFMLNRNTGEYATGYDDIIKYLRSVREKTKEEE